MSEYIYATDGHEGHWLTGEEIVRCIDCIYFYCLWTDCCVCTRNKDKLMPWVEPNGFCAWGEKKVKECE